MSNGTFTSPVVSGNGTAASLSSSTTPVKATIVNRDTSTTVLHCMFNPKEYSFTKNISWQPGETKGTDVPQMEFKGGKPATLKLDLWFDTYGVDPPKDVRTEYTNALWELTLVDESLTDPKNQKGRPPIVTFHWGTAWSFDAVITDMTQKFMMFLADGTPVRAFVSLTFQQIKDDRKLGSQNPTSGGGQGVRLWTVQESDTLAWISYKQYGSPTEWRRIADANRLTQVRRLRPGTVLEIPGV